MTRKRIVIVAALLLLLGANPLVPGARAALDLKTRQRVFDIVWTRVKEKHYDPKLGGVDWNAVRKRYAPRVVQAKTDAAFYALLEQMLGELKQSHFGVIPPAAYVAEAATAGAATTATQDNSGETGLVAQLVEDQPIITRVLPGGAADKAGLRPGFVLVKIGDKPVAAVLARLKAQKRRPAVEGLNAQMAVRGLLAGPVGQSVTLTYKNEKDEEQTTTLTRTAPPGEPVQFAQLPPILTETESRRVDDNIGYVRFNIFLLPLLEPVRTAIRSMKDAPGIILDLRGNLGGVGAMAPAIAAEFANTQTSLGAMRLRTGEFRFPVFPAPDPYAGPLVILTDEGSVSTSEILAGSLQELGRATVIGRATPGMVLPSQIEALPGGARLQFAFADFKTPKGVLLEGRGVSPTVSAGLTRRDYLSGRDPILEAAVAFIRGKGKQETP